MEFKYILLYEAYTPLQSNKAERIRKLSGCFHIFLKKGFKFYISLISVTGLLQLTQFYIMVSFTVKSV